MYYVDSYIETIMGYHSMGHLWYTGYFWSPSYFLLPIFGGRYQQTFVNDLAEKFCFEGEGIFLKENGHFFTMMGLRMVFGMIVG